MGECRCSLQLSFVNLNFTGKFVRGSGGREDPIIFMVVHPFYFIIFCLISHLVGAIFILIFL
jgi:hypothetical protein